MLFAEDIGPVALTSMAVTVLTVIGGGVAWLLTWLRTRKKEEREAERQDADGIIARWQVLLDRQRKECDEHLKEQDRRFEALQAKVEAMAAELGRQKEQGAENRARIRYLEGRLRESGIKFEVWDSPGTDTHSALGG